MMMTFNLLTLLTYSAVWVTIFFKKSTFDKRILRCLTIIVLMVVFGFVSVSLTLYIDNLLELEDEKMLIHNLYRGVAINGTIALNYVVYYVCSAEYRIAFKEQLKILICKSNSAVNSTTSVKTAVVAWQKTA